MRILLILKEPFLDRIPSLKTMILYLADKGYRIDVCTSKSARFGGFSTVHENIRMIYVNERSHKFESPTVVKVAMRVFQHVLAHKFDLIIGGDAWGNIIARQVSRITGLPHVFFALEFPQIIDDKHPKLPFCSRKENEALRQSSLVITHDQYHGNFIRENFKIAEDHIVYLPNASFTDVYRDYSRWLTERFNIAENKVIALHSGGFGKWFRIAELAHAARGWSNQLIMAFHTGRKSSDDLYFDEIYANARDDKFLFSTNPLSNQELDMMISSAHVGIALYSVEALGYRAELMGLAAGKIGNYLKCGVPVVATRLPSLEYIERYECGVLVDDELQIENAINHIMANRDKYRENAFRCYSELWHPAPYLAKIDAALKSLCKKHA